MTDKQIIIDGVPVQDCCYFDYENDGYEDSCYIHQNECSAQNCYYKQHKRSEAQCEAMFVTHTDLEKAYKVKEQECERLKKIINEAKNSKLDLNSFFKIEATVGEYQLELDQLKADNRILKEKFEIAIKNNMDKTLLRLENGDVKEELQEIREEFGIETLYCHDDNTRVHRCIKLLQLKDCLTEIKEIAEALDCKNPEKCWVNDISITGDCLGCEPDKYEEPRDLADCPSHLAHIILQKISEVKDD